jgi:hypothetical protein
VQRVGGVELVQRRGDLKRWPRGAGDDVERFQASAGDHRNGPLAGVDDPAGGELAQYADRHAAGRLGEDAFGAGQ